MADIFLTRIPHIYFVYGLAFFSLGLAVFLELGRTLDLRLKRALWPLAVFGLVHGSHEWFEMFIIAAQESSGYVPPLWMEWVRIGVLASTFLSLGVFGVQMILSRIRLFTVYLKVGLGLLSIYLLGILCLGVWLDWNFSEWLGASDAWTRYSLGIPGALLAAGGLLAKRRFFRVENVDKYANSLALAALSFFLYGAVGQLFVTRSALFPSTVLHSEAFINFFGFPIQVFRTLMAVPAAFFTIRALRGFDVNRQRKLEAAQREARRASEQSRFLRGELFLRTVTAQEEERARLARELHDEIGQVLAGMSTGLRGVQKSLGTDPNLARHQLQQLENMNVRAIKDLDQLVADLRPSLLDDMGLKAALEWYVDQINKRDSTRVELIIKNAIPRLPEQIETTLFRISQEALNNILRHAEAPRAEINLNVDENCIRLQIMDNGKGFDMKGVMNREKLKGWGLLGIRERVTLVDGTFSIQSAPGKGTILEIEIPFSSLQEKND